MKNKRMVTWRSKKPETINYRTLKPEKMVYSAKEYLDQPKIGNVIVENIKG